MALVRLLGPIDVVDGSGAICRTGSARRRTLLALLALRTGEVLSPEWLLEHGWAGEPPESGLRALRFHVSQLRKELDGTLRIETRPGGYELVGGADVVDSLPVGFVLDPLEPTDSPDEAALEREAESRGVRIVSARVGQLYELGELRIRVLWPDGPGQPGEDPHEHGVVLLASYGQFDALLTGDSESPVTLPLRPPEVELLKVAHHGSSDEGLGELLRLVRPKIALISVGEGNDYGHPAPSTLSALASFPGLALYRTDEDGRITVESDGVSFSVRTER